MKYRTMVTRYGYAVVEADNEEEALESTRNLNEHDFDWSAFSDEQVVEEVDFE